LECHLCVQEAKKGRNSAGSPGHGWHRHHPCGRGIVGKATDGIAHRSAHRCILLLSPAHCFPSFPPPFPTLVLIGYLVTSKPIPRQPPIIPLSPLYCTPAFRRRSCCGLPQGCIGFGIFGILYDPHVSGVRSPSPVSSFLQFNPKLTFVSKVGI